MKFYIYNNGYRLAQLDSKCLWDRFSRTHGLGTRPQGKGPTAYTVVANRRTKGAKRWKPPRR